MEHEAGIFNVRLINHGVDGGRNVGLEGSKTLLSI
jgi:hypothetical protein